MHHEVIVIDGSPSDRGTLGTRGRHGDQPADCTNGADMLALPVRRLPGGTVLLSHATSDGLIQLMPAHAQHCGCTGQAPLPLLGLWNT